MQLRYGTYLFGINATSVIDRQEVLWNKGGQAYKVKRIFEGAGWVYGSGTSGLATTAEMLALRAALQVPNQDLQMVDDNGANSAFILINNDSSSGVRVEMGPDWDKVTPYNISQHFTFKAWAEFDLPGTGNFLLDFHETLTFSGGLPEFVCQPATNGPGIRTQTWAQEPFRCLQEGYAVGFKAFPPLPQQKFPNSLKKAGTPRKTSPERRTLGKFEGYRVDYHFEFEDVAPLFTNVNPTIWLGTNTLYG